MTLHANSSPRAKHARLLALIDDGDVDNDLSEIEPDRRAALAQALAAEAVLGTYTVGSVVAQVAHDIPDTACRNLARAGLRIFYPHVAEAFA